MGTTLSLLCPICPHPSAQESDWSDEDLDSDRHRVRELERKQKEEEEKRQKQKKEDYCPSEPEYDPTQEAEAMPKFTPKMKLALDPNYYPPNYVPGQEEDSVPSLVSNLVPPPDKLADQEKDKEQNNKDGEEEDGKKEDGREDLTKTQTDTGRLRTRGK